MLRPQSLLLLLLIVFAQLVYAEIPEENCLPYTIVFGNGVGNSMEDARLSRDTLSGLIGSQHNNREVNYDIAFNPSEGPGVGTLLDVIESAKQKAGENNTLWSLTWRVIFGVVDKAEPNQSWVETIAKIWTDFNTKIVNGMRYNLANKSTYYDDTVVSHVALYKSLLTNQSNPQQILLVAHSQGNLYGNIALQKLEQHLLSLKDGKKYLSRFAMVGVGSAADFVYKDGPYLTSTYDTVINAVRTMYPTVLLGNIIMPAVAEYKATNANGEIVSITDYTGHGFATTYTNNAYAGRALLKSHIERQLDLLKDDTSSEGDADNDGTYTWFGATENINGGLIDDESVDNYPISDPIGCWEQNEDDMGDCLNQYNRILKELFYTTVAVAGTRWPGEKIERGIYWVVPGNGEQALEQIILPRIFSPANPGYVGFSRNDAKIKYRRSDVSSPYIYQIFPPVDVTPVVFQLVISKEVEVGVKACKKPSINS